jgi:hypothetical protein
MEYFIKAFGREGQTKLTIEREREREKREDRTPQAQKQPGNSRL